MHGRRSLHLPLEELNPEIERTARSHSRPITPMADPPPEDNAPNNGLFGNQNIRNGGNQGREQQAIKDYFIPGQNLTYGGFGQPPLQATHYEIKPGLLNLLPNFYGRENEDPYAHLTEFLDISSIVRFMHFTDDALRLKLFPFR